MSEARHTEPTLPVLLETARIARDLIRFDTSNRGNGDANPEAEAAAYVADFLRGLPLSDLQAGTSELKTWITLAGVLEAETTRLHEIGYIPCYRTPAGTGTAQGMYWWQVD